MKIKASNFESKKKKKKVKLKLITHPSLWQALSIVPVVFVLW